MKDTGNNVWGTEERESNGPEIQTCMLIVSCKGTPSIIVVCHVRIYNRRII